MNYNVQHVQSYIYQYDEVDNASKIQSTKNLVGLKTENPEEQVLDPLWTL